MGALLAAACERTSPARAGGDTPPIVAVVAPSAPAASPAATATAGGVRLEPPAIHLGTLRPDQDADFEFEVVNDGATTTQIVNVDGSCECLGFTWERGPLPPGGRRRVTSKVHAQNRGQKILTAFVDSHDGVKGTHSSLDIAYIIVPELAFAPARADFGRRLVGSPTTLELVASWRQVADATPIELAPRIERAVADDRSPLPPITVEPAGEPVVRPLPSGLEEVERRLRLTLDTKEPLPSFALVLVFESERHLPAKLPLTGSVHRGWYLDPDQIHLGVVAVGTTRRGTARLTWMKDEPKVQKVECEPPELVAEVMRENGSRSYRVTVSFTPKGAGDLDGVVRIRTDLAPEPLLLRVKGKVR